MPLIQQKSALSSILAGAFLCVSLPQTQAQWKDPEKEGAIPHYQISPSSGNPLTVDNFQKESKTSYRFEGIDYGRDAGFTAADQQKKGKIERNDGTAILSGNGIFFAEGRSLRPGECIVVTIVPAAGAFTGIAIGNTRIDIGNYAEERQSMPLLFRTGPTEWELKTILVPERGKAYLRMVIGQGAEWPNGPLPYLGRPVSVLILRGKNDNKNKIFWRVTGAYAHGQGVYTDPTLPEKAPFGLCHNAKGFKPYATVTSFQHGTLNQKLKKLPPLRLAPWVPENLAQRQTWDDSNARIASATKLIEAVPSAGKLTKKEIESIKKYYQTCGYPHSNMQNSNVFSFEKWGACANFYRLTGDIWFLDHAAQIAERILLVGLKSEGVLAATMDNGGLGTVERFVKMPGIFPHMRRCFYNEKEELITQCDTAQASLLQPSSAFCLRVAENKELWGKVMPDGDPNKLGKTYKERAVSYLDILYTAVSHMVPYRLNKNSFVFEYPDVGKDPSPVMAYNRWYLSIAALPEAASAMEIFGVHPERVKYYDKMVQSGIDNIRSRVVPVKHPKGLVWTWPYRYDKPAPPAEDYGHGGATLNMLRRFYESGRYKFPEEELRRYIRAYLLLCYDPKTQTFSYHTDGNLGGKSRKKNKGGGGFVMFGKYFHEFDDWFMEPASKVKNVFSIMMVLQRRAEKYGVEGMSPTKPKTIK